MCNFLPLIFIVLGEFGGRDDDDGVLTVDDRETISEKHIQLQSWK